MFVILMGELYREDLHESEKIFMMYPILCVLPPWWATGQTALREKFDFQTSCIPMSGFAK
jgi:hypothetical protein